MKHIINNQLMLAFTNNSKNSTYNINQLDFQPLVISNKSPPALPFTKNPQKKISKTVTQPFNNQHSRESSRKMEKKSKEKYPEPLVDRQGWQDGGKISIFDGKLSKNHLAQQQRRIRAQAKKRKVEGIEQIVKNEKQIRSKTIKLEKQQQTEIVKLKKMIEKERQQKEKNDRLYEIKMKQIEKERNQLLQLQRKIQENGVKNQKQFKKQIKVLTKNEYPANDRAKCHQDQRQPKRNEQITQSQMNHQYNALRQHQLQLLTKQRQKCLQNQLTIDYNPTIIPLLSRASYKIISTHISTLVQLFIDDLLEEQVYLLEQIELKEKQARQQKKSKEMINDYYQQLSDFVGEAEEIQSRVGRYSAMKFQDLYIPKRYEKTQTTSNFKSFQSRQCLLQGVNEEVAEEIQSRKDRLCRFLNDYDYYKKSNLNMFQQVTEQIIDEALTKMAKQLDKGSGDFVELIFRKQFE